MCWFMFKVTRFSFRRRKEEGHWLEEVTECEWLGLEWLERRSLTVFALLYGAQRRQTGQRLLWVVLCAHACVWLSGREVILGKEAAEPLKPGRWLCHKSLQGGRIGGEMSQVSQAATRFQRRIIKQEFIYKDTHFPPALTYINQGVPLCSSGFLLLLRLLGSLAAWFFFLSQK